MDPRETPRNRGSSFEGIFRRLLLLVAIWYVLQVSGADRVRLHHEHSRESPKTAEKPFTIVWNVNTLGCRAFKVNVDVTKYGILENEVNDDHGEYVSLLNRDFGYWPFLDTLNHTVHGGAPQAGNVSRHLAKFRADLERVVPADFKGLGVIDFENWFAQYDQYYTSLQFLYHNLSYYLAKQEHPDWPDYALQQLAQTEFEQGAKIFYLETLKVAQDARPGALWGHYHYPKCFRHRPGGLCDENSHTWNDRIQWLANASDALYPSGYFHLNTSNAGKRLNMHANTVETIRWRQQTGDVHKPIYVYTKAALDEPSPYYSWLDLVNSIGQTADLGVEGNLVWGNKLHQQSLEACQQTKEYIDGAFGPYVKTVLEFTVACSEARCSSHGRCSLKNISLPHSHIVRSSDLLRSEYKLLSDQQRNLVLHTTAHDVITAQILTSTRHKLVDAYRQDHRMEDASLVEMYECHCYQGWKGDKCQEKAS